MKEYHIYRSLGNVERDIGKHELIGLEYGKDIFDAADRVLRAIRDDASELPENKGYEVDVFAPEEMSRLSRKTRYAYRADAVIGSPALPKNKILPYGIVESDADKTGISEKRKKAV